MTTLGIVGVGRMGSGIAALAVHRGVSVIATDTDHAALEALERVVEQHLFLARRKKVQAATHPAGQLTTSASIAAMGAADLVIETIPENTQGKRAVLAELIEVTSWSTAIASNTSGIPISDLTDGLADANQVLGIHLANPPLLRPWAELVRAERTGTHALAVAEQVLNELGVHYEQVADVPLMVINALIHPFMAIAARLAENGVATVDQIDRLVVGFLGHPQGPFALAEQVIGPSTVLNTLHEAWLRTGDPVHAVPQLLYDAAATGRFPRTAHQSRETDHPGPSTKDEKR